MSAILRPLNLRIKSSISNLYYRCPYNTTLFSISAPNKHAIMSKRKQATWESFKENISKKRVGKKVENVPGTPDVYGGPWVPMIKFVFGRNDFHVKIYFSILFIHFLAFYIILVTFNFFQVIEQVITIYCFRSFKKNNCFLYIN